MNSKKILQTILGLVLLVLIAMSMFIPMVETRFRPEMLLLLLDTGLLLLSAICIFLAHITNSQTFFVRIANASSVGLVITTFLTSWLVFIIQHSAAVVTLLATVIAFMICFLSEENKSTSIGKSYWLLAVIYQACIVLTVWLIEQP